MSNTRTADGGRCNVVVLFVRHVLTPLCNNADWFSWVLFGSAVFIAIIGALLAFNIVAAVGFVGFYANHAWEFWYLGWALVVASTIGPMITLTRDKSGIPIGLLISVAVWHLLSFIVVSSYFLSKAYPNNPAAITALLAATATGAMVGVGWLVQHNSAFRAAKRTHTFNVLVQSRLSKEFGEHVKGRDTHYPVGVAMSDKDAAIFYRSGLKSALDDVDAKLRAIQLKGDLAAEALAMKVKEAEEEKALISQKYDALQSVKYILNFYEFICAGITSGELDEKLIHATLGDIALGLYNDSYAMVAKLQQNQPRSCEAFWTVASCWKAGKLFCYAS